MPPTNPKDGRLSVAHFIYPPLDLVVKPIAQNENGIEDCSDDVIATLLSPNDEQVISPQTLASNHWYPGVKWIEFHQNQMMQCQVNDYIKDLPYYEDVKVK